MIYADHQLAQRLERAEARSNAKKQGFRLAYTRTKWQLVE